MKGYILLCILNSIYMNFYRFLFNIKVEKANSPFPVYLVRKDGLYKLSTLTFVLYLGVLLFLEIIILYRAYVLALKQETEKKKIKALLKNAGIYGLSLLVGVTTILFIR